jgi:hypothetical protein
VQQYKRVPVLSKNKLKALRQKEKDIAERYRIVRAPYRKKQQ